MPVIRKRVSLLRSISIAKEVRGRRDRNIRVRVEGVLRAAISEEL